MYIHNVSPFNLNVIPWKLHSMLHNNIFSTKQKYALKGKFNEKYKVSIPQLK